MHVLCLIADPARAPLDPDLVRALAARLTAPPRWLADAAACEFALAGDPAAGLAQARALADGQPVDLAVVPAAARRKRLLISDMDSTMITVECIDELADMAGVKAEVAAITRRAMNGELDFAAALRARARLLEGLSVALFEDVYRERVRMMPGAATLVATMRAGGAVTALVSGGFVPFAERVRAALGFDLAAANELETQGGRLTGRLLEPIRGAESKVAMLQRLRSLHGLRAEQILAVGDGANDLPMLQAAGLGVAFRAHPRVAAAAATTINYGDLTALLYLQGIAADAFVAA